MYFKEQRDRTSPAMSEEKPGGGLAPSDTKTRVTGIHCAGTSTGRKSAEERPEKSTRGENGLHARWNWHCR